MKNQKKQLITLITLFAFLIVAYFGIENYNTAEAQKEEEANTIIITEFTGDEVTAFSYDYNGETYSYTKNEDVWLYDGDTSLDMDETIIISMLDTAGSLLGEDVFSEYESLDTYGLNEPAKTIYITMSDATEHILKVGDYNDIVGFYYFMVEGDSNLYLVDSTILNTFEVSYASLEYVEEVTEEATEETTEEATEEATEKTTEETTEETTEMISEEVTEEEVAEEVEETQQ